MTNTRGGRGMARRADRLQDIADELRESHGAQSLIVTADLSQKDACQSIVRRLEEESIGQRSVAETIESLVVPA